MVELKVKVVPSSSRDCIAGWLGNSLKIRVQAPAEDGKAGPEDDPVFFSL